MHACAWASLRERFEKESGAASFTEVFQFTWPKDKPLEDVWREWVKKSSKPPQGSLTQHAIEHLATSGLQRHGQPEPEHHWLARRPNTRWQILVHCLPPPVTTTDGDRCRDAWKHMPEVGETNTPAKGLLAQTRNLSELCRHPSAHEVQGKPSPKITVKEVWCVANKIS